MARLAIALGLAGAVLLAAMVALPRWPTRMSATAPMGSTITVTVAGDGSSSLYSTHRYWDYDCTVTGPGGRQAALRPDTFAQTLPGGWWPRGELIDAGELTVSCSSTEGGRFGIGPTRSAGFLLLRGALLLGGAGLLIAAGVLALLRRRRRRRNPAAG